MNSELLKFFSVQRQIFGVCSCWRHFPFGDAKVYLEKLQPDWMDKLQNLRNALIPRRKNKCQEAATREVAREKGRKAAMVSTKKIDTILL